MTYATDQEKELNALGISKSLRRNLVVGVIVIEFIVIMLLVKYMVGMHNDMLEMKDKQIESNAQLYERIINHIDKRFKPLDTLLNTMEIK